MKTLPLIAVLGLLTLDSPSFADSSACASLVGNYGNPNAHLAVTFDATRSMLMFRYSVPETNQKNEIYLIADGARHAGDGMNTGNHYVAQCAKGLVTADEKYDMGDLKKVWQIEGDEPVETGSLNGSAFMSYGRYKRLH